MARGTETQLDILHGLVTTEYTRRVQLKEKCPTADLKAAAEWLVKHNWTGLAKKDTPLAALLEGLTEGDQAFVERLTQ
jgi:hypothetical protein